MKFPGFGKSEPEEGALPDASKFQGVEIPNLKEKKNEKKGAGATIPGGAADGGRGFIGAGGRAAGGSMGGGASGAASSAASSALSGAAGAAAASGAAGAAGGGGVAGLLGFLASKAGIAALALLLGGGGLIGLGLMKGSGGGGATGGPKLDGLESSINVRKRNADGSRSLAMMADAGAGELKWEDPNKKKDAPKPEGAVAEGDMADSVDEAADEAGEEENAEEGAGKPKMARADWGKLASGLGNSSFGGNDIFKGGTGFNAKGLSNAGGVGGGSLASGGPAGKSPRGLRGARGQLSMGKAGSRANLANASRQQNFMSGAMGQANFAKKMSQNALTAGGETEAATAASNAFDGQSTDGAGGGIGAGGASGGGTGAGTTPAPIGTGAPANDPNSPWNAPETPDSDYDFNVDGMNISPDQQLVEIAQTMLLIAGILVAFASVLNITGTALICSGGYAFIATAAMWCGIIGAVLAAAVMVMAGQMQDSEMKTAYMTMGGLMMTAGAAAAIGMAVPGGAGIGWIGWTAGVIAIGSVFTSFLGFSSDKLK